MNAAEIERIRGSSPHVFFVGRPELSLSRILWGVLADAVQELKLLGLYLKGLPGDKRGESGRNAVAGYAAAMRTRFLRCLVLLRWVGREGPAVAPLLSRLQELHRASELFSGAADALHALHTRSGRREVSPTLDVSVLYPKLEFSLPPEAAFSHAVSRLGGVIAAMLAAEPLPPKVRCTDGVGRECVLLSWPGVFRAAITAFPSTEKREVHWRVVQWAPSIITRADPRNDALPLLLDNHTRERVLAKVNAVLTKQPLSKALHLLHGVCVRMAAEVLHKQALQLQGALLLGGKPWVAVHKPELRPGEMECDGICVSFWETRRWTLRARVTEGVDAAVLEIRGHAPVPPMHLPFTALSLPNAFWTAVGQAKLARLKEAEIALNLGGLSTEVVQDQHHSYLRVLVLKGCFSVTVQVGVDTCTGHYLIAPYNIPTPHPLRVTTDDTLLPKIQHTALDVAHSQALTVLLHADIGPPSAQLSYLSSTVSEEPGRITYTLPGKDVRISVALSIPTLTTTLSIRRRVPGVKRQPVEARPSVPLTPSLSAAVTAGLCAVALGVYPPIEHFFLPLTLRQPLPSPTALSLTTEYAWLTLWRVLAPSGLSRILNTNKVSEVLLQAGRGQTGAVYHPVGPLSDFPPLFHAERGSVLLITAADYVWIVWGDVIDDWACLHVAVGVCFEGEGSRFLPPKALYILLHDLKRRAASRKRGRDGERAVVEGGWSFSYLASLKELLRAGLGRNVEGRALDHVLLGTMLCKQAAAIKNCCALSPTLSVPSSFTLHPFSPNSPHPDYLSLSIHIDALPDPLSPLVEALEISLVQFIQNALHQVFQAKLKALPVWCDAVRESGLLDEGYCPTRVAEWVLGYSGGKSPALGPVLYFIHPDRSPTELREVKLTTPQ